MQSQITTNINDISVTCCDVDYNEGIKIAKKLHLCAMTARIKCVGLAHNQMRGNKRVFVAFDDRLKKWRYFINPVIKQYSDEKIINKGEACMSLPKAQYDVSRSIWIKMEYTNKDNETVTQTFEGDFAIVLQHEYDHLNGICLIHHLQYGYATKHGGK